MKKGQVAEEHYGGWVLRVLGGQALLNTVGLVEDINYYPEMVGSMKTVT